MARLDLASVAAESCRLCGLVMVAVTVVLKTTNRLMFAGDEGPSLALLSRCLAKIAVGVMLSR